MFEAKGILLEEIKAMDAMNDATAAGRGYGVAGGVASAIEGCIKEYYPDTEIHIEHAESLSECKKILMLAKAGKKNGCLIEGMACPGGCVAGGQVRTLRFRQRQKICSASKILPNKNFRDSAVFATRRRK